EKVDRIQKTSHRDIETYQLGDTFATVAGAAIIVSNRKEAIHMAIDLHLDGPAKSVTALKNGPAAGRKMLPNHPLAWTWINMETVHNFPESQEAYKYPRGDAGAVILIGGLTDVTGKAPFVAAGNYRTDDGFRTTIRMGAGRDATPPELTLHLPP